MTVDDTERMVRKTLGVVFNDRAMEEEEEDEATDFSDSQILLNALMIYGSIFVVVFFLFCILRLRHPKTYAIRGWVEGIQTELAKDQFGFLSWLWKVHQIDEVELMKECGMDAVCFVRLIHMGFRISCVGAFTAAWLIPIYWTAEESSETEDITDTVVKMTIAHVPAGSSRLYATIFAAYFVFGYTMYHILEEFTWYIEMRHKFLRTPLPKHFTVFCRNIPKQFQNNEQLKQFFANSFGEENVLEARVPLALSHLEKAVTKREDTLFKLEHALAMFQKDGQRPTHKEKQDKKKMCGKKEEVDSIEYYTSELEEANDDVAGRIDSLQAIASGSPHLQATEEVSEEPAKKTNGSMISRAMSLVGGGEDGHLYPSGFVVFKKIGTTNAALQMVHHQKPFAMEILEAPDPDSVYWGSIGRTHKDLQLGNLASIFATVVLCVFWTIPMSFFASLSNVEAVRQDVDFLDDLFNDYPGLVPVFEQLAPFFVVIFNALLPIILEQFTLWEGPISSGVVASSTFVKLAAFMIIQTFFVSAISGSIFQAINDIIDDWTEIIDLLANALPSQGTYFMQILMVTTTMGMVFELPRLVPVIMASLRKCIGPNLTENERKRTVFGLRPITDPAPFLFSKFTSQLVLYFIIMFVYAVISPLTAFVTGGCFLFMMTMYKHQFIYIYPIHFDSGGKLWSNFIQIMLSCMMIAQITILGLLGLKKGAKQIPIFIPLLVISVLFTMYIRQMHFRVAAYLPSHEGMTEDALRDKDFDYDSLRGQFVQPALGVEARVQPDSSLTGDEEEGKDAGKGAEEEVVFAKEDGQAQDGSGENAAEDDQPTPDVSKEKAGEGAAEVDAGKEEPAFVNEQTVEVKEEAVEVTPS